MFYFGNHLLTSQFRTDPVPRWQDPIGGHRHAAHKHIGQEHDAADDQQVWPDVLDADRLGQVRPIEVQGKQVIELVGGQIRGGENARLAPFGLQGRQLLQQSDVGVMLPELGRIRHIHAGQNGCLASGRDDRHVVTARHRGVEFAHITARRQLMKSELKRFQIRTDRSARHVQ